MVCLASCDKTTPGQLMAAGRLDIPTIVVVCGYQKSGEYRGKHVDIEDVFLKSGYVASGRISVEDLAGMADVAVQSPGVCAGMGTANSMHIGLRGARHGAARQRSGRGDEPENARAHARSRGTRIVEMVWDDLKPRTIITAGVDPQCACCAVLAVSGSINCVKHLQAIATEADVDVDVYELFADYADKIPLLAAIRPNGPGLIEEFEAAGGARAVLKRLERFLDLDARTVTGRTLGDVLANVTVADERVIRTRGETVTRRGRRSLSCAAACCPAAASSARAAPANGCCSSADRRNIFHSRDEALEGDKAPCK